jgi:BMFP domain-containing protein YqiC
MQHYPRKLYARDEMQIALDEIDKLRDSLDLAQKMHITGTDRLNATYAKAEQLEAKLAKFHLCEEHYNGHLPCGGAACFHKDES